MTNRKLMSSIIITCLVCFITACGGPTIEDIKKNEQKGDVSKLISLMKEKQEQKDKAENDFIAQKNSPKKLSETLEEYDNFVREFNSAIIHLASSNQSAKEYLDKNYTKITYKTVNDEYRKTFMVYMAIKNLKEKGESVVNKEFLKDINDSTVNSLVEDILIKKSQRSKAVGNLEFKYNITVKNNNLENIDINALKKKVELAENKFYMSRKVLLDLGNIDSLKFASANAYIQNRCIEELSYMYPQAGESFSKAINELNYFERELKEAESLNSVNEQKRKNLREETDKSIRDARASYDVDIKNFTNRLIVYLEGISPIDKGEIQVANPHSSSTRKTVEPTNNTHVAKPSYDSIIDSISNTMNISKENIELSQKYFPQGFDSNDWLCYIVWTDESNPKNIFIEYINKRTIKKVDRSDLPGDKHIQIDCLMVDPMNKNYYAATNILTFCYNSTEGIAAVREKDFITCYTTSF